MIVNPIYETHFLIAAEEKMSAALFIRCFRENNQTLIPCSEQRRLAIIPALAPPAPVIIWTIICNKVRRVVLLCSSGGHQCAFVTFNGLLFPILISGILSPFVLLYVF